MEAHSLQANSLRLVALGLTLLTAAGCAGERYNTRWTSAGYRAFNRGDYATAARYFEGAVKETPNEPYYELDLAATYQAQDRMDLAGPIYRQVLEHGTTVRPARATSGSRLRTLADIACDNLRLAPPAPATQALPCQPIAAPIVTPPPPVAQAAPPAPQAAPVPPPVPPAAAAGPAPLPRPSSYLVYFDFDRDDLTATGRTVVESVAADARRDRTVRIRLVGKADRAGPEGYNQRLSDRRAATVRQALITMGVDANQIDTVGVGETQPPVPTPDEVREQLNRVVEITIR